MAKRYTGHDYYSSQGDLFAPTASKAIRSSFKDIGDTPYSEAQIYYGAKDVAVPFLIYKKMLPLIEEASLEPTVDLENRYLPVLASMTLNGVWVHQPKWLDNYRKTLRETESLHTELKQFKDIN